MRKLISIAIAAVLVVLSTAPVFAHGSHHSGRRVSSPSYSVCTIQSCTKTGAHTHDGKTYIAHYYGDGHDYHGYCDVSGCTLTGYHGHDDTYCFGHTANDGHSYHRLGRHH